MESNQKIWKPAAYVVMGLPITGCNSDVPLAVRGTIDEALAEACRIVKSRLAQGYSARGCAMYVQPTEEQVEVLP